MKYVLVDIDGTICDSSHRKDDFDNGDWTKDEPIGYMIDLVRALYNDLYWVVLITCRKERHRGNTEKWLLDHRVPYRQLVMQPEWFSESDDCVVKWLEFCFLSNEFNVEMEDVLLAIDDQPGTVEMWRTNGINTLLVKKALDDYV